MKTLHVLIGLASVTGLAALVLAQDRPATDPLRSAAAEEREIRELQKQVGDQQAQLKKFEKRMDALEQRLNSRNQPVEPTPLFRVPGGTSPSLNFGPLGRPLPSGSTPPKIWGQREINGWTFYLVPLAEP